MLRAGFSSGIRSLRQLEITILRKTYSERAQICFDLHVVVDGLEEGGREDGTEKGRVIGTTKKGKATSLHSPESQLSHSFRHWPMLLGCNRQTWGPHVDAVQWRR